LYHLNALVTQYGQDPDVTRCLGTRAFYICPRVNPDGAEWALGDPPRLIRSSTRPYPHDEDPVEGLVQEDVDGDGRLLAMRVPDPNGAWKVHADEPRLMVRRGPTEEEGEFYRVLPEGRIEGYDGVTFLVQGPKEGLDLNRNFPTSGSPPRTAGPYPTSEPETRALADFIVSHPNIVAGVAFHTSGGVLIRPPSGKPDKTLPLGDLEIYRTVGKQGEELTGYPHLSIYDQFVEGESEISGGLDWAYDKLGRFFWAVELWCPQRRAGIEDFKAKEWGRDHPIEDDLKLIKWNDEKLGGKAIVEWYPFDHPQLGRVELGGWHWSNGGSNPTSELLEEEVASFPPWLVYQLLISPRLELLESTSTPLGDDTYRVRLVVHNTGWLPTNVTQKAMDNKCVRGVVCEIGLGERTILETGKLREEFGQLAGRSGRGPSVGPGGHRGGADGTHDRLKAEWIVRAPEGGTVTMTARHERAGKVRAELRLSAT